MGYIASYPKIYNLGHKAIADLFEEGDGEIAVQEKYDGSQLSWSWGVDGQLVVRSKGSTQFGPERTEPDGMFEGAVDYLKTIDVPSEALGLVFRGEWFAKPKHNTIAYERRPKNGIVLFDVSFGDTEVYLDKEALGRWADLLGVEAAVEFDVIPESVDDLKSLLDTDSSLGGAKIEGVVIKNYGRFGFDGKVMMGKYVSEQFKERHKREWKKGNPSKGDVIDSLIQALNTEARWRKAVQHLRDEGQLTDSPKDIGPLMKELKRDTQEEEIDYIVEKLVEYALPRIIRGVGRGFPEWYKEHLAERQFEQ